MTADLPVPFQDIASDGPAAVVAYLRFVREPEQGGIRGALFVTAGHGDPLEFCFTRVETNARPLWDPERAYQQAVALLARALFEAANHSPDLVLALAGEAPTDIFFESLAVQAPLGLVAESEGNPGIIRWVAREPAGDSHLSGLVEEMKSRRSLLEPFWRAERGLAEAYAER